MRAAKRLRAGDLDAHRGWHIESLRQFDASLDLREGHVDVVGEEAEGPHLHEPGGQCVLKEAVEERGDGQA